MPKTKKRKQLRKLSPRERQLAMKYVPEELKTKKYKRKMAIAIGLSRARRSAEREKVASVVRKYL
jgi:hypothetical protein